MEYGRQKKCYFDVAVRENAVSMRDNSSQDLSHGEMPFLM
jgi:hypothetical protein